MCGITGIVSENTRLFERLPEMVSLLEHRGPDDNGIEYLDGVALGHRRLSIIDLGGGHQPMYDKSKTNVIVFNGEIYNYPALKKQLEAEGCEFNTNSDTEVILELYAKHGENCLQYLEGMFAFGIWDQTKKKLFLARDHIGQKPVFYCVNSRSLCFGSEVKSVLASNLVEKEVDLEALYHYISLRFVPDNHSLFKGVQKLQGGHYLVFQDGCLTVKKYWTHDYKDKFKESEQEITEQLDSLLTSTVKEHMLSDVPV